MDVGLETDTCDSKLTGRKEKKKKTDCELTSVDVRVLLHITLLVESLSTILARVGSGIAEK